MEPHNKRSRISTSTHTTHPPSQNQGAYARGSEELWAVPSVSINSTERVTSRRNISQATEGSNNAVSGEDNKEGSVKIWMRWGEFGGDRDLKFLREALANDVTNPPSKQKLKVWEDLASRLNTTYAAEGWKVSRPKLITRYEKLLARYQSDMNEGTAVSEWHQLIKELRERELAALHAKGSIKHLSTVSKSSISLGDRTITLDEDAKAFRKRQFEDSRVISSSSNSGGLGDRTGEGLHSIATALRKDAEEETKRQQAELDLRKEILAMNERIVSMQKESEYSFRKWMVEERQKEERERERREEERAKRQEAREAERNKVMLEMMTKAQENMMKGMGTMMKNMFEHMKK
mmetsp:Transcript_21680/g.53069  ORF Transcript_21680/g.53069 Transcript_21680/m.53069 type:complete len:348 (+) Transcript_21680:382-1425(+)